jgi:hypothetical protein
VIGRLISLALIALLTGGVTALAQQGTPVPGFDPLAIFPAHIHAGTCEAPGEVAFPLGEGGFGLPLPVGGEAESVSAEFLGSELANPAIVVAADVDAALSELQAGEYVIDAHTAAANGAAEDETRIVCGPIGGFLAGGDLVFGLNEVNATRYGGSAWLRDDGDGSTTVALFLISGLTASGGDAGTAVTGEDAAEAPPEAVAEAEPLVPAPPARDVTGTVIENHRFVTDEIRLLAGIPSAIHVVNSDERAYRFYVVDLIDPVPIPPLEMTVIELTTPTTGIHEGQLLAAGREDVLDVVPVIINEYEPFS